MTRLMRLLTFVLSGCATRPLAPEDVAGADALTLIDQVHAFQGEGPIPPGWTDRRAYLREMVSELMRDDLLTLEELESVHRREPVRGMGWPAVFLMWGRPVEVDHTEYPVGTWTHTEWPWEKGVGVKRATFYNGTLYWWAIGD